MSLLFAYDDRSFEMNMNDHQEFVIARLEEQVLDITEKDI
jgi:hypothetical protein